MSQRRVNLAATIVHADDAATLKLSSDTISTLEIIEQQLQELVDRRRRLVLLDLSALDHLSSIGLGMILSLRRAVVGYGGEVRIAAANPNALDVLRRTSVDVLFNPSSPGAGNSQ